MNRKRKLGRELLSFLLTLAMVVGMMPGMGITAHAGEPTEALLTTITATGKEQASYSTENVASVSFSYTANGSSSYVANWGWWGYGWIATVTPADGYTITKCVFYDDVNSTAEDSEDPFVVETTEEDKYPQVNGTPILAYNDHGIKKIDVYGYATPTHTHDFTYSVDGDTITARCTADGCELPPSTEGGSNHVATLTIAAPQNLTYDGTAKATVITDASGIQGSAKVMYQKKDGNSYGTAAETAPKDAGTYKGGITLGGATASVEYTIEPAALTISGATLTDRMYQANNKKVEVSSVTFTGGSPVVNTDYTATAEMTDDAVGDNKSATVTVTLKNNNYTLAANTTQSTVNITRYRPDAPGAPTAASRTDTSITLATTDGYQYKLGDGDWQDSAVFTGLTADTSYTFYQRFKGDGSSSADSESSPGASIKTTQVPIQYAEVSRSGNIILITIRTVTEYIKAQMADNTVWLKDGDFYVVKGNVTLNRGLVYTGNVRLLICDGAKLTIKGGIWHYGSELTIYGQSGQSGEVVVEGDKDIVLDSVPDGVNASAITKTHAIGGDININSGKLKVMPGSDQTLFDTGSKVTVSPNVLFKGINKTDAVETQAEGTYQGSVLNEKFKTIETNVKAIVTKTPEAKTLTVNGSAQALVSAGEAFGGTMQYAIGENATTAPTTGWSDKLPTATNAGTYYIWYKAVGDASHTDTAPNVVTVTIAPGGSSRPSSSGGSSTPSKPSSESYTVPVSNEGSDKGAVDVNASISNGTAEVANITADDIAKITDDKKDDSTGSSDGTGDGKTEETTTILIDVSGAKQEVTSVELKKETVETLAEASENNDALDGVTIKMTDAEVSFDGNALNAINDQAKGDNIIVVVEESQITYTQEQTSAVEGKDVAMKITAKIISNGTEIHNFRGGQAIYSVKHEVPAGKDPNYYNVFHLADDGTLTKQPTRYINGFFQYKTTHNSEYVLIYDKEIQNDTDKGDDWVEETLPNNVTKNEDGSLQYTEEGLGSVKVAKEAIQDGAVYRMYNPNSGEHFYTKDSGERDSLVKSGWTYEADSGFDTPGNEAGVSPVYRVYNPNSGLHHYTIESGEAKELVRIGWNFEGISFFAYGKDSGTGTPLYRAYNPNDGTHNYTASKDEQDYIVSLGWNDEQFGWSVK